MNKFIPSRKIAKYIIKKRDQPIHHYMNIFLGIGVCKYCGYINPDIEGYCFLCLRENGSKLIKLPSHHFNLIRKGKIVKHFDLFDSRMK